MAAAAILDFVGYELYRQKLSRDLILDVCVKFGENPFKNGGVIAVQRISKWRPPPSWIYALCEL